MPIFFEIIKIISYVLLVVFLLVVTIVGLTQEKYYKRGRQYWKY